MTKRNPIPPGYQYGHDSPYVVELLGEIIDENTSSRLADKLDKYYTDVRITCNRLFSYLPLHVMSSLILEELKIISPDVICKYLSYLTPNDISIIINSRKGQKTVTPVNYTYRIVNINGINFVEFIYRNRHASTSSNTVYPMNPLNAILMNGDNLTDLSTEEYTKLIVDKHIYRYSDDIVLIDKGNEIVSAIPLYVYGEDITELVDNKIITDISTGNVLTYDPKCGLINDDNSFKLQHLKQKGFYRYQEVDGLGIDTKVGSKLLYDAENKVIYNVVEIFTK